MSGFDKYDAIKNEIQKRIDIVSLIERYVPLKRSGNKYMGLCPFHNEKTPSFSVVPNENGGYYNCFGCQESGDSFTFIMKKEGLNFLDAMRALAKECGVAWNIGESENSHNSSTRQNLLKATEFATNFFYNEMTKSNEAKNYFKSRGITGETAKEFRLGFAPNSWDKFLLAAKNAKFSEDLLIETALAKRNPNGVFAFFRNRFIFPIFDNSGRAVAFGGRAVGDEKPKYLNSSNTVLYDKSRIFYGYFQAQKEIRQQKTAILVEGYMDMISLYQNGIKNVIATCGTSFSEEKAKLLSSVCEKVVIILDGDDAGIKGAKNAVEALLPFEIELRYALIPGGHDPDDFVRENGKNEFLELVKNAQDGFSFLLENLEKEHNVANPAGKSKAVREISSVLANVKNEIMLSDFITKISTRWKISVSDVKRSIFALRKNKDNDENPQNYSFFDENKRIFYTEAGKILQLLFWYPQVLQDFSYDTSQDFFAEPFVNKLFLAMKNGKINGNSFLHDENLSEQEKNFLLILANERPNENEEEAKINAAEKIRKFRRIGLQKENEKLKEEIREEGDEEKRKEMLAKVAQNQREISALQKKKG